MKSTTAFVTASRPSTRRTPFFADSGGGKPHFDLEAYVCARLAAAGIERIEALGLDTYGEEQGYFSYRRATHCGDPAYGRQMSVVALAP